MNFVAFVVFVAILDSSRSQQCPMQYQRFSSSHTYCLSSTCQVVAGGKVSDAEKIQILKVHNSLRSKVATGGETQYHSLPSASNMMQMEWDEELARVAQAHANQCKFQHDTSEQRAVGNFSVGQNLLQSSGSLKINWTGVAMWYTTEVQYFRPEYIDPFQYDGRFGHFSQVIWAPTWKIGCGVAGYVDNGVNRVLYTCNYGPAGNMIAGQAYKVGPSCSSCPKNTICSFEYPGLCKSLNANGPQISRPSSGDYLLYCDLSNEDPTACSNVKITGTTPLTNGTLYTGRYLKGVFKAGDTVTIKFGKFQHPNGICPFINGRFGPNKAGEKACSSVRFHFSAPGMIFPDNMKDSRNLPSWRTIGILMRSDREMEVSYIFEVEKNASPPCPEQYFEFKAFGVRGGKCP